MSLHSPTGDENGRASSGRQGWPAGIQVRGMRPETSMSPGFQHSMLE
jgi:hypothetical protein